MFEVFVVYTSKTSLKEFAGLKWALAYAKKHDKEVWKDTVTKGGLIVDTVKVYPIEE